MNLPTVADCNAMCQSVKPVSASNPAKSVNRSAGAAEQAALQRAQLLENPNWHPSEAEKAAAFHAVEQPVVSRQATLPLGVAS